MGRHRRKCWIPSCFRGVDGVFVCAVNPFRPMCACRFSIIGKFLFPGLRRWAGNAEIFVTRAVDTSQRLFYYCRFPFTGCFALERPQQSVLGLLRRVFGGLA